MSRLSTNPSLSRLHADHASPSAAQIRHRQRRPVRMRQRPHIELVGHVRDAGNARLDQRTIQQSALDGIRPTWRETVLCQRISERIGRIIHRPQLQASPAKGRQRFRPSRGSASLMRSRRAWAMLRNGSRASTIERRPGAQSGIRSTRSRPPMGCDSQTTCPQPDRPAAAPPSQSAECLFSTRPQKKSTSSAAIRSTRKREVHTAVLRACERRPRQICCRETELRIWCGLFQRSPTNSSTSATPCGRPVAAPFGKQRCAIGFATPLHHAKERIAGATTARSRLSGGIRTRVSRRSLP